MKEDISEKSKKWVKENKKKLVETFVVDDEYYKSDKPFTIFMAGSPGAGKTEFSKGFIEEAKKLSPISRITRIDADEIKEIIPGYNGSNSDLFQGASSLGVEKLYDYVLKKNISAIVDGTLANYEVGYKNISRSIARGRKTGIFYIYQDPLIAWKFTKAREELEGRHIPKEAFINSLFSAKDSVNKLKKTFGKKLDIFLIIKDYNHNIQKTHFKIDRIDSHLKIKYTKESLSKKL